MEHGLYDRCAGTVEKERLSVTEEDLVHLSPARYEHINPYGQYQFNLDETPSRYWLHPLRQPQAG